MNVRARRFHLPEKSKRIVVEVISYLFIALFIYAAANKLFEFERFKAQMGQSAMLTSYASILAWAIPCLEVMIALLLFLSRTLLIGLYMSFSLMVLFSAYIGILLMSGEHLPCSCGGVLQQMSWSQHLVFNLGFVGLGFVAIILCTRLENHGV